MSKYIICGLVIVIALLSTALYVVLCIASNKASIKEEEVNNS